MLHVSRGVVEEELGRKVVETRRLRVELEADQGERLACYLTYRRVRLERAGCVLHDAILHWCVACVVQLYCLVDALVRAAVREADLCVA